MRRKLLAAGIGLAGMTIGLAAAPAAGAATFSNGTPITIPAISTASVYPSSVVVSGMNQPITDVNVTLNAFSHTFPDDVGVVVVGPQGRALLLMDCMGGNEDAANLTLSFDDSATTQGPAVGPIPNGPKKPTNHCTTAAPTSFPAPGPLQAYQNPGPSYGGTATLASTFNGQSADGTWNLYVADYGTNADAGAISGGWTLEVLPDPVPPKPAKKKKCKKPKKKAEKGAVAAKKGCKKKRKQQP